MNPGWISFLGLRQPALSAAPPHPCAGPGRTRWRAWLFYALISSLWSGAAGAATLRLTWQDKSNNESGFKIERLDGSNYVPIASLAANVASYTDSSLAAGKTYCYRVRSYNSGGVSAPTNAACTTTAVTSTTPTQSPTTPPSSGTTFPTNPSTPGPVAPTGKQWSDYLVSVKIRSADNDAIGVLFRYRDEDNYYRFSWFAEGKSRRLEKRVDGVFHVLAQDAAVYAANRSYALQISASGSALKVTVDGKTIFSVKDTSLAKGTIGLYSYYNAGSYFDDVRVQDLLTGNTLLADDFKDGNSIGWTMVDEGDDLGPSKWSVVNGALAQTGNIGSTEDNGKLGTHALYTRGSWADYRMTLKLRSSDDDRLGVMFRVQDNNNYYRLSWNRSSPGRRLWKREKGVFALLAEDTVPYTMNRTYGIEIIAKGNTLTVNIDGKSVFSVTDPSFKSGTIALYSSYNQSSFFDDILVEDLATKSVLLWDDFNDGNLVGWKAFDDAGTTSGPSIWSVVNGALVQSSNIGSDATGHPGTFLLY